MSPVPPTSIVAAISAKVPFPGASPGPADLQGRRPFINEFVHALAAKFQKIRNAVPVAHGRAPGEIIESPIRVFAGLYRQGRRHDAADVAVELQRPPLDEAP